MELGMYTLELSRPTVETLFRDIRGYGFTQVQFDFLSVLGEQMPAAIDEVLIRRIRGAADDNGVRIAAVNGTFNMIHPDALVREDGIRRFAELARHVKVLGCDLVTLCTGSRDPDNMWRWHEDNGGEGAWDDLMASMGRVLAIAEAHDLTLGLEPEASNVMNTAQRCRKLLDAFKTPRLKVILDVANLFQKGQARRENVRPVMRDAFDLLGGHIALAHGKDIREGEGLSFTHAGNGIVDFLYFKELLDGCGYRECMLLHGIRREEEFPQSVEFVRSVMGG